MISHRKVHAKSTPLTQTSDTISCVLEHLNDCRSTSVLCCLWECYRPKNKEMVKRLLRNRMQRWARSVSWDQQSAVRVGWEVLILKHFCFFFYTEDYWRRYDGIVFNRTCTGRPLPLLYAIVLLRCTDHKERPDLRTDRASLLKPFFQFEPDCVHRPYWAFVSFFLSLQKSVSWLISQANLAVLY